MTTRNQRSASKAAVRRRNPPECDGFRYCWALRGGDLNPRPLGYEPNELPDCSTPRQTPHRRTIACSGTFNLTRARVEIQRSPAVWRQVVRNRGELLVGQRNLTERGHSSPSARDVFRNRRVTSKYGCLVRGSLRAIASTNTESAARGEPRRASPRITTAIRHTYRGFMNGTTAPAGKGYCSRAGRSARCPSSPAIDRTPPACCLA